MKKNSYLSAISVTNDHTVKLAQSALEAVGSPLAGSLANRDFLSIVNADFPSVLSPNFKDEYFAYNLLRKYPFKIKGVDRKAAAMKSFVAAEATCGLQNLLWANLQADPERAPLFLRRMRVKIRQILGPFRWEFASHYCGFGPGASYTLPRSSGDAYYKFRANPDVTSAALPYFCAMLRWGHPLWAREIESRSGTSLEDACVLVPGNRVTTVPKDAKRDRTIAIEPLGNMFLQKGIGGLIRARLKAIGLNLNQQQPVNQALALEGSLKGNLATIDLSSASDSVSMALVEYLLPKSWLDAINCTRSAYGVLPDRSLTAYEKVSSMGNGFTFELETLLFLACALVLTSEPEVNVNVAVYGDDIIVPVADAPRVLLALDAMGFTPNAHKTFIEGPFRESCGKHYHFGVDVTPLYVDEPINRPQRYYWFANSLKRWSALPYGLDSRMKTTWDLTVSCLPRIIRWRFLLPSGVGDNGLVVDFDEAHATFCPKTQSMRFLSFAESRETQVFDDESYLLRALRNLEGASGSLPTVVGSREPAEYHPGVIKQTPHVDFKPVFGYIQQWTHTGPWY